MTKYALFSDVHGNYYALKAVLKKINQIGVDQIFCLGDILLNHGATDEVIELLDKNQVFLLRGNHDEPLGIKENLVRFKHREWVVSIDKWLEEHTSKKYRERLANLPITHEILLENGEKTLLFHSHPDNLWEWTNSAQAPMDVLEKNFAHLPADILIYGHYHQPHMMRLNGKILVNVASVDSHTNVIPDELTRFTLLESLPDRNIFTQYTLSYDIKKQNAMDKERNVPPFIEREDHSENA